MDKEEDCKLIENDKRAENAGVNNDGKIDMTNDMAALASHGPSTGGI